jgi:hypothetical protein
MKRLAAAAVPFALLLLIALLSIIGANTLARAGEVEITYLDEQAFAAEDPFPNLPPVRTWRHSTFYCEAEQNPPEGWLRPGGYCDQVLTMRSLLYSGTKGLIRYVQP